MDITKHEVTAGKYRLNFKDILKGILIAAGTAALFAIQSSLDTGSLDIDWKKVGMGALAGGITYLIKNYLSPAVVKIPISDNDAKKITDAGEPTTAK